jgi:hypothetical protein
MSVKMSEDQIRTLAFYLWELDGRPSGRADEYWEKAISQLCAGEDGRREKGSDSSGFGDPPEKLRVRPLAE